MKPFCYLYIDLFRPTVREIEPRYRSWISGPNNYDSAGSQTRETLAFGYIGDKLYHVQTGRPSIADHFLSILDERRLCRATQDMDFVASTLDPSAIEVNVSHPVRFLTSAPAAFYVLSGEVEWQSGDFRSSAQAINRMGKTDAVPMFARIEDSAIFENGILLLTGDESSVATLIVVSRAEQDVRPDREFLFSCNDRRGRFLVVGKSVCVIFSSPVK